MSEVKEMGTTEQSVRYYRLGDMIIELERNGRATWDDGQIAGSAYYEPEKDRLVLGDSFLYRVGVHLTGTDADKPEWVQEAEDDHRRHSEWLQSAPVWDLTKQVVHWTELEGYKSNGAP